MSHYLNDSGMLWPTMQGQFDVRSKLPVGTYTVGCHPQKGWFLKPIADFNISGKIYGKTTSQATRILNTFSQRPSATGVLLSGEKGSGKTMLAKLISQQAAKDGISTIVINEAFTGDSFNNFIQSIDEACIIVFDEFEKVFNNEEQEKTLTLLDGVYPSKKLFILTVNDKYRVNQHLRNRPGRIFYLLDYNGLDSAFITEYCDDNLNAKEHIPQIVRLALLFDSFNFDMLKALVEDMNRYNETPNQVLEMLNAKPFDQGNIRHRVSITHAGKEVKSYWPSSIRGNPIAQDELEVGFDPDPDNDESDNICLSVTPLDLRKVDPEAGTFTYVFNDGRPEQTVLVFTREAIYKKQPNYLDI